MRRREVGEQNPRKGIEIFFSSESIDSKLLVLGHDLCLQESGKRYPRGNLGYIRHVHRYKARRALQNDKFSFFLKNLRKNILFPPLNFNHINPNKPYEMDLQRHTELIKHLIDDFVDPDCYRQCIIDREENCLKERVHILDCDAEIAGTQGNFLIPDGLPYV